MNPILSCNRPYPCVSVLVCPYHNCMAFSNVLLRIDFEFSPAPEESVTISIYKCLWFEGKIKVGHCSLDLHVSFPE